MQSCSNLPRQARHGFRQGVGKGPPHRDWPDGRIEHVAELRTNFIAADDVGLEIDTVAEAVLESEVEGRVDVDKPLSRVT